MTKLKPCPFCGGEAEYSVVDSRQEIPFGTVHHFVSCKNHCIEGLYSRGETKEDAIEAWNRRAEIEGKEGKISPNWHTGTPAKEGLYIVYYWDDHNPLGVEYEAMCDVMVQPVFDDDGELECWVNDDRSVRFEADDVIRWQRIEPFKEESNG